jgi:hypothetical protein
MGHYVHDVDISKPLAHMMPYTLSAICPVQLKPALICEEHTSPACQWPSKVSISPLKLVTTSNCSQVNGREINLQLSGNSSGRHSYSQHANSALPQLETSVL